MSGGACCGTEPRRAGRRGLDAAGWLASAAGLVFLPKCPACLAGYVALATGVGLSFSTASVLRTGFAATCVAALVVLTVRLARRART